MPTYDYLCDNCGHTFEKFEAMSAKPARKCPNCAKMKLKRLIGTGAAIIFKGSGFYQTDYRTESYNQGKKSETSKAEPTAKDDKKTETKSETKTDTKPKKQPAKSTKKKKSD